jgi:DNA-binding NtrC family response regulator
MVEQNLNGRLYQIVDELESNRGNFCRSAKSLGVHRNTLRNKVSDLGIGCEDYDLPGRRQQRRRNSNSPPL